MDEELKIVATAGLREDLDAWGIPDDPVLRAELERVLLAYYEFAPRVREETALALLQALTRVNVDLIPSGGKRELAARLQGIRASWTRSKDAHSRATIGVGLVATAVVAALKVVSTTWWLWPLSVGALGAFAAIWLHARKDADGRAVELLGEVVKKLSGT